MTSKLDSGGGYSELARVAYVGPGRPLGFTFDQHNDMLICDSTIVSILDAKTDLCPFEL